MDDQVGNPPANRGMTANGHCLSVKYGVTLNLIAKIYIFTLGIFDECIIIFMTSCIYQNDKQNCSK